MFYNDISHFILTGGGGEGQALLWRRHGATNVLDRVVAFPFFQWHTTRYIKNKLPYIQSEFPDKRRSGSSLEFLFKDSKILSKGLCTSNKLFLVTWV